MELDGIRMFIAVAETGSFTKAAKSLFVSHSTVSRAISALEEEFGVRLFDRDNRVFGLTAAGNMLLPRARELASLAESIESEIRAISNGE